MWNEFTVDRSIPGDRGRIKMVKFAETMSSVMSHTNITFSPDYDFSSLPHIDILFIPGGKEAWRKLPIFTLIFVIFKTWCFLLGTSSRNSKVTGEGEADVPKIILQFLAINSDF